MIVRSSVFVIAACFMLHGRAVFSQHRVTEAERSAVESAVRTEIGADYRVWNIVDVSASLRTGATIDEPLLGPIEDPYATLADAYVFTAVEDPAEPVVASQGVVGVYRNQRLIWHSGTTIINSTIVCDGGIFAITDLDRDGAVEILSYWTHCNRFGPTFLWIFEWDGTDGSPENSVSNSNSAVWTGGSPNVDLIDFDGDGIQEIQGHEPNPVSRDEVEWYPVIFSKGSAGSYRQWPETPSPGPDFVPPRDRLKATLSASVAENADGLVLRYSLANDSTSIQKIDKFHLDRFVDQPSGVDAPSGWKIWRTSSLVYWEDPSPSPNFIQPGERTSEFAYGGALPRLGRYYVQGYNPSNAPIHIHLQNVAENALIGYTIVATDPPEPFVALDFLETLRSHGPRSAELGWIENEGILQSLQTKLDNARQQLESGNSRAASNVLRAFVSEVEAVEKNHLSREAFALLKFNGEYLIEQLALDDRSENGGR